MCRATRVEVMADPWAFGPSGKSWPTLGPFDRVGSRALAHVHAQARAHTHAHTHTHTHTYAARHDGADAERSESVLQPVARHPKRRESTLKVLRRITGTLVMAHYWYPINGPLITTGQ